MKDAVYARHLLATTHSDYCRSLRLAGSALSSFGSDEHLSVSENTPAIFLRPSTASINHEYPHVPTPMLEIGRAELDRSFSKLRKTVYHSSSVLSNLSATWTSKPPLAVKYKHDASTLNEQGSMKSLCSTLDRILAWEKKLYEEVKAREGIKIEHEKKLSALQSHEYKGRDESKLEKN